MIRFQKIWLYVLYLVAIIATSALFFTGKWESVWLTSYTNWRQIFYSQEEKAMNYIAEDELKGAYIQAHQSYELLTRHQEDKNMTELLRLRRIGDKLHTLSDWGTETAQIQLLQYVKTLETACQENKTVFDTLMEQPKEDLASVFYLKTAPAFQKLQLASLEHRVNEFLIKSTYCGPKRILWMYRFPLEPKIGEPLQIVIIGYHIMKGLECKATITNLASGEQEECRLVHHGNFTILHWTPLRPGEYKYAFYLPIKDKPALYEFFAGWEIQVSENISIKTP